MMMIDLLTVNRTRYAGVSMSSVVAPEAYQIKPNDDDDDNDGDDDDDDDDVDDDDDDDDDVEVNDDDDDDDEDLCDEAQHLAGSELELPSSL